MSTLLKLKLKLACFAANSLWELFYSLRSKLPVADLSKMLPKICLDSGSEGVPNLVAVPGGI